MNFGDSCLLRNKNLIYCSISRKIYIALEVEKIFLLLICYLYCLHHLLTYYSINKIINKPTEENREFKKRAMFEQKVNIQ